MNAARHALLALTALVACAQEPEGRVPFTGSWVIKGGAPPSTTASQGGSVEAAPPVDPSGSVTPTEGGCDGIPEGGTCAGSALRICVGDKVVELSCADGGGFCVVNKVAEQATCIYPEGGNPCTAMKEPSTCKGDVVLWCDDGVLKAADCTTVGKVCAYDDSQGFDACVTPP